MSQTHRSRLTRIVVIVTIKVKIFIKRRQAVGRFPIRRGPAAPVKLDPLPWIRSPWPP